MGDGPVIQSTIATNLLLILLVGSNLLVDKGHDEQIRNVDSVSGIGLIFAGASGTRLPAGVRYSG